MLKEIVSNLLIFVIFSVMASYIFPKMPQKVFYYNRWIFRDRKWEDSGIVCRNIFKVRGWKKFIPELHDFIKSIFPRKDIKEYNRVYLSYYLIEA